MKEPSGPPCIVRTMRFLVFPAILPFLSLARADVFTNVPEAKSEGYQVLYEINIPANAAFTGETPVDYAVNRIAAAPAFDRVAYYLELTDTAPHWAYASMDAFTDKAAELAVPHEKNNPVTHRRTVSNLNVFSNVPGVTTGTFLPGGAVEIWANTYNKQNDYGFYAGNDKTWDWGDKPSVPTGYGSFQIHNVLAGQTILAWNRWSNPDDKNDDIGIGKASGPNADWTMEMNAGNFTRRKLVVLVRPALPAVTLAAFPAPRAIVPRDHKTNTTLVPVAGEVRGGNYDTAILQMVKDGSPLKEGVQKLTYTDGVAKFSFSPKITAGFSSHDFELLLAKGNTKRLVARSADVASGDVICIYGQSNSEAGRGYSKRSESSAGYASRWIRTFGQNADSGARTERALYWVDGNGDGVGSAAADPGAIGQWGVVLARKLSDEEKIPVAVINGGRGGYSMPKLAKDTAQPANLYDGGGKTRTYNRMLFRAENAGVAKAARALFYYQGESDKGNVAQHAAGFQSLMENWKTDYPALEKIYEVQLHVGCGTDRENTALRELQRTFGDTFPNVTLMSTNGLQSHDGCHYRFKNGYETLGLRLWAQLHRDLYNGPAGPEINPPNPLKAAFIGSGRTKILLTLREKNAKTVFPPGALADFQVGGLNASPSAFEVRGNEITFTLPSPAPAGPITLEYRGHSGGGDFVTNGAGIGLLTFQIPVAEK